ncbi:unnamed protein product [Adineta ricciae]|uniref:Uncharacterized protein n=1 Tax=Adineta ricciae TaxID=249248 RepID=A0A814WTG3_ADIRI|nr:unnamed protein product [Adineta ricciae]
MHGGKNKDWKRRNFNCIDFLSVITLQHFHLCFQSLVGMKHGIPALEEMCSYYRNQYRYRKQVVYRGQNLLLIILEQLRKSVATQLYKCSIRDDDQ